MNVKRITPVLFVKEIQPILTFWVDRLGFSKTIEVPHGDKLGFVALNKGATEVMYQTFASLGDDMPAILDALKDSKIVQPERTAFYGMREVGYQDPGGHFITFAQPVAAAQH